MRLLIVLLMLLPALAGCGVVSGAASVAGAAVDVTSTVVSTTADVVTAPVR